MANVPNVSREDPSPEAALAGLYAAIPNSGEASLLLDRLVAMSEALARREARTHADILTKISLWRVLASEDARSYDNATPDEALALSIMDDCERLWARR